MSILIDDFIDDPVVCGTSSMEEDGNWYIAKPMPYYSLKTIWTQIKDAFRVLFGKSIAVHYKRDE